MKNLITAIRSEGLSGIVRESEPMSRHCSLKVGGLASFYAVPGSIEDLISLLGVLKNTGTPWMVIGGGTNIFFSEGGYRGCIIKLQGSFTEFELSGDGTLDVGAGAATQAVFAAAVKRGMTGMEFVAGIPGTIGGAVKMNAGTRDGSLSDIVRRIQVVEKGQVDWKDIGELEFGYRRLAVPGDPVITRVNMTLDTDDSQAILARVNRIMDRRKATQPLGVPSAGCWFLNPRGESAGRLIEEAGMKGKRIGGAEVSRIHANFLVNRGDAVPSDFEILADQVKEAVREKFGILLKEEVQVVQE